MKVEVFKPKKQEWTFCIIPAVIIDNDYFSIHIAFVWLLWAVMISKNKKYE